MGLIERIKENAKKELKTIVLPESEDERVLKAAQMVLEEKTANVVLSNAFDVPTIAVDTHVFRVSNRLGLAESEKVEEVENQLMDLIPRKRWSRSHHLLIFHGRRICKARKPNCEKCPLNSECRYYSALK